MKKGYRRKKGFQPIRCLATLLEKLDPGAQQYYALCADEEWLDFDKWIMSVQEIQNHGSKFKNRMVRPHC